MDHHEALLGQVFDDKDSVMYQWSKQLWSQFCYWHHLVGTVGCADDQPSRDAHAEEVREQAEQFMETFIMRASEKHVTVYMHIMQCHCHELIKLHGSLDKFCSQAAEAIHQETRFAALKRSDRHVDNVAAQVFCRVRIWQELLYLKGLPKTWRKPRRLHAGRSKATAEQRDAMIEQVMFEHQNRPDGLNDELIRRLSRLEDEILEAEQEPTGIVPMHTPGEDDMCSNSDSDSDDSDEDEDEDDNESSDDEGDWSPNITSNRLMGCMDGEGDGV
jgi:hypothetical protein